MGTDSNHSDDLQRRVEKLENELSYLREVVGKIGQQPKQAAQIPTAERVIPVTPPHPASPAQTQQTNFDLSPKQTPTSSKLKIPEQMKTFEYWLNRFGIGLLLFGVVFMFKYSIDQGWITPWLRIGFALGLGGLLVTFGLRLHDKRRTFATILIGGAIGTWYIAGFSAFQLLNLVSHPQAMLFMGLVTIFSFYMATKQNLAVLSIIGALGGFGTPFLLYTGSGNLPGLILYTCILIALSGGLFYFKGWLSLLWTTVVCGWAVIITGIASRTWFKSEIGIPEQWSVEAGLIFSWLVFGGVPLIREMTWLKNPTRWTRSTIGFADKTISSKVSELLDRHLHVLAVSSPIIAYTLSIIIWPHISEVDRGWTAIGLAVIYAGLSFYFNRSEPFKAVGYTHGLVAVFFTTIGLTQILDGNWLLISLATEGMILHLIATRINSRMIRLTTHFVCFIVGTWVLIRLSDNLSSPDGFWSASNLADLLAIITFVVSAISIKGKITKQIYAIGAIFFLMLLFIKEFGGNAELVMIGLEGLVVFLIGRLVFDKAIQNSSHGLFIVGAVFLIIRYTTEGVMVTPIVNLGALADILFIGLLGLIAATDENILLRRIYGLGSHLAILGLLASEFSRLDNGHGWVSVTWGAYGALLLILGLRKNIQILRITAMGTLGLLVLKLFMFDLARLETIWKVLLFTGVGGAFLGLSYFFPALWKDQKEKT